MSIQFEKNLFEKMSNIDINQLNIIKKIRMVERDESSIFLTE